MHVLYKLARVYERRYRMPASLRIFRDCQTLIICRAFLIRISLLWGKTEKRRTGAARQKHLPRTGIILYFSYLPFCFVAFVSTILASRIYSAYPFIINSLVARCTSQIGIRKRTYNAQRLAYPKIIDHMNSREDTWSDLPQYLVLSLVIFPESCVISILDLKNSGVSYGFS